MSKCRASSEIKCIIYERCLRTEGEREIAKKEERIVHLLCWANFYLYGHFDGRRLYFGCRDRAAKFSHFVEIIICELWVFTKLCIIKSNLNMAWNKIYVQFHSQSRICVCVCSAHAVRNISVHMRSKWIGFIRRAHTGVECLTICLCTLTHKLVGSLARLKHADHITIHDRF